MNSGTFSPNPHKWAKSHQQTWTDLNQMSSSHQTCHLSDICVQTTAVCTRQQMTYNGMQATLSHIAELSPVWLASIPAWPSVIALSCSGPGNFFQCKCPQSHFWQDLRIQLLNNCITVEPIMQDHSSFSITFSEPFPSYFQINEHLASDQLLFQYQFFRTIPFICPNKWAPGQWPTALSVSPFQKHSLHISK